jgi:hypothetical protein
MELFILLGVLVLFILFLIFISNMIYRQRTSDMDKYVLRNSDIFFEPNVLKNKNTKIKLYNIHNQTIRNHLIQLKNKSCKNSSHKSYHDCVDSMWDAKKSQDTTCVLSHLHLLTVSLRKNINFRTLEPNDVGKKDYHEFKKILYDNLEYVCAVTPLKFMDSFMTNITHYSNDSNEKLLAHQIRLILTYEKLSRFKNCKLTETTIYDALQFSSPIIRFKSGNPDIWKNVHIRDIIPFIKSYKYLHKMYISILKNLMSDENSITFQFNLKNSKPVYNVITGINKE